MNNIQPITEPGLNYNLSVLCRTYSISTWLCCRPKEIEDQIRMTNRNWKQDWKIHQPSFPTLFFLFSLPPVNPPISANPQTSASELHKIRHSTVLTISCECCQDHFSKCSWVGAAAADKDLKQSRKGEEISCLFSFLPLDLPSELPVGRTQVRASSQRSSHEAVHTHQNPRSQDPGSPLTGQWGVKKGWGWDPVEITSPWGEIGWVI